jgi:hypothetical protein
MLFTRTLVANALSGGLPERSRSGSGLLANLLPLLVATDAAIGLTIAQISTGLLQFTGFTAGRVVTTPTAALILAAAPDMDIGDSFSFIVSVVPAFAATWAAGVGVTLTGRATTPASSWSVVTVTRTGAATHNWNVS